MLKNKKKNPLKLLLFSILFFFIPLAGNSFTSPLIKISKGEFLFKGEGVNLYLPDFYIDSYETTNVDYEQFIAVTKHRPPVYVNNTNFNQPAQPVTGVSFDDASAYCKWKMGRLPTEAQWVKAAGWDPKKKIKYRYPWGNDYSDHYLNGLFSGHNKPSIIGLYSQGKSPYGLSDMGGNVWEWTADWFAEKTVLYDKNNKKIENFRRVVKGGSWGNKDNSDFARVDVVAALEPHLRLSTVGFRCVKDSVK